MLTRFPYTDPYEANPYQLPLPGLDAAGQAQFLRDQAENLREQHNTQNAGDSAFPWQLCTGVDEEPQYTPGSVGRFLHPAYGILVCRYVRFDRMLPGLWSGAPVGLLLDGAVFSWRATNDISHSDSAHLIGLGACYAKPTNDSFGWVIVSGANIQGLRVSSIVNRGDQLGWGGSGFATERSGGQAQLGVSLVNGGMDDFNPGTILIGSANYAGG